MLAAELECENIAINKERCGQLMMDMQQISIIRSLVAEAETLRQRLERCGIEPSRDAFSIAESLFALTSAPMFAKNLFKAIDSLPKQPPAQMLPLYDAFRLFLAQTPAAIWAQGVEAKQKALEQIDQKRAAFG
jgi:hypothetical protein